MSGLYKGVGNFRKHQLALAALTVLCAGLAQAQQQEATLGSVEVVAPAVFGVTQNLGAKVGAGALGNVTQKDTPFSSAVVTNEQILEQGSQKLGDLFIQDASVSDNTGANTAWGTYLTVRGIGLDWENAWRMDGKPFLAYSTTLPYEHFEQIELLKGATGFMYGFGTPGGVVNYITKKPTAETIRDVTLGYSSESLVRANADFGGRAGEDGALGYRLNATREQGNTANGGKLERSSVHLALDAKLSDRLSWDFQTMYQDRLATNIDPSIRMSSYTGSVLPATVKNDQKLVTQGNYTDNEFAYVATGLKYKLAPDWEAQARLSRSYSKTRRNETILYPTNASGSYTSLLSDYAERYQYNYGDVMVQGQVQSGVMRHNIVTGISYGEQLNDASTWMSATGQAGNLYAQNPNTLYDAGDLAPKRSSEVTQLAAYVSDRLELNDRWSVLGGLRWNDYESRSLNASGVVTARYEKSGVVTPTLAVMNKLNAATMAYVSYVESLEKGSVVGSSYANAGAVLDPVVSKQWEMGVKTDTASWSGTAALFRVEKGAEYANASNVYVQDGRTRYQGLELGATARLSKLWSLGGNLMLLDSEYVKGSSNIGKEVAGAPEQVLTAQVAYRVPQVQGLQVRLGAKHTGATPLRADNTLYVDSYTLFSLGATYDTTVQGYATTFRANVNNLTDRKYWMYQYADYIKAGDPRSINLSATLHF